MSQTQAYLADDFGEPRLVVDVDIKPDSSENAINLGANGNVPVAVLSTGQASGDPVDFNVEDLEVASVQFSGSNASQKGKSGNFGAFEDVDGDGDLDMVFHFPIQDLDLTPLDVDGTLIGVTKDGTAIEGTDLLNVVPAN